MADMNYLTRIENGRRVPSEVINIKTGERLFRAPVDAKEMIATKEWKWAPVPPDTAKKDIPSTMDSNGNPLVLERVDLPAEPVVVEPVVEVPIIDNPETVTLPTTEVGPPVVKEPAIPKSSGLWKAKGK